MNFNFLNGFLVALCFSSLWLSASDTNPQTRASFDKERLPEFKAEYSFPAASLKVYDGEIDLRPNGLVKIPRAKDCAWIVKGIKPGKYYLGVFAATGRVPTTMKYPLFLNGKRILFDESAAPVKIDKAYYSELLSKNSVFLKNGDELRVHPRFAGKKVGQLNLYLERPNIGIVITRKGVISDPNLDDYFRPAVKLERPTSFKNKAKGKFSVTNALIKEQTLKLHFEVVDFFSTPVFTFEKTVTLKGREKFEKSFEYPWGDSDKYKAELKVTNDKGHMEEAWDQILTSMKTKFRSKEWINDDWKMKGVKNKKFLDLAQLEGGEWKKISLPFNPVLPPRRNPDTHIFWYKRNFSIPDWMKDSKRFFLTFSRVGYDAEIYFNGKKIRYVMDSHNPCRIEISKLIAGKTEYELLVGTRDSIASLAPKELKKDSAKVGRYAETIAPIGHVCLDETYIEGLPETYVEDARIVTSFRKKKIDVQYEISDIDKNDYTVDSAVYFKGKQVFGFEPKSIAPTKAEKLFSFDISGEWKNPVLWSYWEPNLLCLKTVLKMKDGKIIDEKRTRFGFREIWPEGIKLFLNGTRIKIASIGMADFRKKRSYRTYIKLGKRIGLTGKVHMDTGATHQEINDEEGILAFLNTPGLFCPTGQKFECDEYWKNAERIAMASVKSYWNHPSVIAWYLSNEWARQNKLALKRLKTLGDTVKNFDSSRLISFGCDLDTDGWNDHISTHYPIDGTGVRYAKTYLPDSARWYPADKKLEKGMRIPCGQIKQVANIREDSPIKWGDKPIFINETGWKLQYYVPHGFARVFGDWAYRGQYEAKEAHVLLNRIFISRHRDIEPSLITPWIWCWDDPFKRIIPKIDIVVFETYSRWFEGENVFHRVNLHCDEPFAKKMKFSCKITDLDGDVLLEESKNLEFQPAELKREYITIRIPEVSSDTNVNLTFSLQGEDGEILCERVIPSKIFSRDIAAPSPNGVLLFDPNNETEKLFKTARIPFEKISNLSSESLEGQNVLVVGRNAAQDPILMKNAKIIENFVNDGGTVLIMNNSKGKINWTPVPLIPIGDKQTSISFRRAPNHPSLAGFADEDVKYWYPKHLISRADYRKPSKGTFISILDSATGIDGMEFVSLIEIPYGKGCYLASQIEFNAGEAFTDKDTEDDSTWLGSIFSSKKPSGNSNYAKNPLAQKLLSNILSYLENYSRTTATLGCVLKPGGNTEKKLASIGLIYKNAKVDDLDKFSVIFAEMDAVDANIAAALKQFVHNGGTVILHKVNLKNKAFANQICDGRILLHQDCQKTFKGRLLKTSDDKIIDGLGNIDLFWKKLPVTQAYEASYSSFRWAKEPIINHPIGVLDGEVLTYPGGLAKLKIGDGTVYVDQINWDTTNNAVIKESDRVASCIFSNLGCQLRGIKNVEIPKELKYETLDISKYLNRSFKDDKNHDGKGGWTDQGSIRDFSKLKPGMKNYNGVPFVIEKGKSCLVLRSKNRKPTVPKQVLDIPVGQKADVIYFLQSSAWTKKDMGKYRIKYENGESVDIELTGGVNMRDWGAKEPGKPFYNETLTKTQRAYTFPFHVWPKKRSIYMMAWPNPKPELKIKSFDFISANNGIPILIAVTLGRQARVAAEIEIVKGDRKKAVELYAKAKIAFDAGDKSKAEKILLNAIKADQSYATAHSRLGRHYRDINKLKDAENQFRIALAIDERAFDVYLMLGEVLEIQKRFADALLVYEKSFKVDENQPRILDAKQRMHKALKK